jgi:hypothetical protein
MIMEMQTQQAPVSLGQVDVWLDQADEYARQEPMKALVSAFGAGFLINLLPIGAIVGALTGVAFAMARPVLLFLGLIKACDLVRSASKSE